MIKKLLCDFHIHTTWSDGSLPLNQVVDLYGRAGFDVICVTDHISDKENINEENAAFIIPTSQCKNYLEALWNESKRAWETYQMLIIPGFEVTNNIKHYHILAIDIKEYIDASLPVDKIIESIHNQNGVAIACHPHIKDSEGNESLDLSKYLWDNHDKYVNLFDAWEIANRDDVFNVVGLKKFNYIANGDFHEERHLYSWKTLLQCEKNTEAVKKAIRDNTDVAIFLFRKSKPQLHQPG